MTVLFCGTVIVCESSMIFPILGEVQLACRRGRYGYHLRVHCYMHQYRSTIPSMDMTSSQCHGRGTMHFSLHDTYIITSSSLNQGIFTSLRVLEYSNLRIFYKYIDPVDDERGLAMCVNLTTQPTNKAYLSVCLFPHTPCSHIFMPS